MNSEPVTKDLDLSTLFGALTQEQESAVRGALRQADERFTSLRDQLAAQTDLSWRSEGLRLDTLPSGQMFVTDYVESEDVTFWIELRRREGSTDAWVVEGRVSVTSTAEIDAGQEVVLDLGERSYSSAQSAAAGLATLSTELAERALARPADAATWRSIRE